MSTTRDLFVFCGQSNMMGACDFPPKHPLNIKNSLEFKYKKEYLGRGRAFFQPVSHDVGEFLYCDPQKAYPEGEENSSLTEYRPNTYFVSSMAGLEKPFATYSEADHVCGSSLLPYFCEEYEKYGEAPLTAHIAKGAVRIEHYFNAEMAGEYNRLKAPEHSEMVVSDMEIGANRVFTKKSLAFFREAEAQYGKIGKKVFLWLQGESNGDDKEEEYRLKLEILLRYIKKIGYDSFFCIRVGYWGDPNIINVIRAQEAFCRDHEECHMVSRAVSFMPNPASNLPSDWFIKKPPEQYQGCRDTYYGTQNSHINEKGFMLLGRQVAQNAYRILKENKPPILSPELLAKI
ncbi:MAG: hypothetical protein IJC32_04205 [Clostridia bacterium]|nr:hypothetical protein [Clostridia bacterium]